jgi:hypothetical protein
VPVTRLDQSRSPLLHPVAIGALALLVVNDHVLKAAWPGLITGKASDVAALVLVPPLVVEIARLVGRGRAWPQARSIVAGAAAVLIAAIFVAVKLHPVANEAYAVALGVIQWPGAVVGNLLAGAPIGPPGRAPTVLDAGDLIALPAAAVGWWVAAGRDPRRAMHWRAHAGLRSAGQIAMLLVALFALAATSQSPPTQVTAVAPDEVLVGSDEPSVERHATIRIDGGSDLGSIVIEARSRWPFVEPAPRFEVRREGVEPSGSAPSNQVSVDPATCRSGCDVPVAIVIDWPGSTDKARTSVAWELVATVFAQPGKYLTYSNIVTIEDGGFAARQHGLAPVVLVLFGVVIAALVLAASGTPKLAHRRGVGSARDAVVLVAGIAIGTFLLAGPQTIQPSWFGPGAGVPAAPIMVFGSIGGIAVVAGLILWWRGNGTPLAIGLVSLALVALPVAGRLIAEASATFAASGLLLAAAATAFGTVALVGALRRPGRIGDDWIAPSRVFVAAIGIATSIALFVASDLNSTGADVAGLLAVIHLIALATWWIGFGAFLGLTSFAIGAGTLLRAMVGPALFSGSTWTGWDLLTMSGVFVAASITLVAAFGGLARDPSRPGGGETTTQLAVAKIIAEREANLPPS